MNQLPSVMLRMPSRRLRKFLLRRCVRRKYLSVILVEMDANLEGYHRAWKNSIGMFGLGESVEG